jgi:hypothetical protein
MTNRKLFFKTKEFWVLQLSIEPPLKTDVLTQYKKSESNPLVIQQHFAEIRSVSSECSVICTGGSKDGDVE